VIVGVLSAVAYKVKLYFVLYYAIKMFTILKISSLLFSLEIIGVNIFQQCRITH